jgi:hypothetical protein
MARAAEILVSCDIAAPPSVVWAHVSDHERTPEWVHAVKDVQLSREGTPRNGVGAIRVVTFRPRLWTTIYEEIVHFRAPQTFHYVLFKGMPGLDSHRGKIMVDDLGEGRCRLRWEVNFVFKRLHPFAFFAPLFLREFNRCHVVPQGGRSGV